MRIADLSNQDIKSIAFGRLLKSFVKQIVLFCGGTFLFYGIGSTVRHTSSVLGVTFLLLSIVCFVALFIAIYKFRVAVKNLTRDLLAEKK